MQPGRSGSALSDFYHGSGAAPSKTSTSRGAAAAAASHNHRGRFPVTSSSGAGMTDGRARGGGYGYDSSPPSNYSHSSVASTRQGDDDDDGHLDEYDDDPTTATDVSGVSSSILSAPTVEKPRRSGHGDYFVDERAFPGGASSRANHAATSKQHQPEIDAAEWGQLSAAEKEAYINRLEALERSEIMNTTSGTTTTNNNTSYVSNSTIQQRSVGRDASAGTSNNTSLEHCYRGNAGTHLQHTSHHVKIDSVEYDRLDVFERQRMWQDRLSSNTEKLRTDLKIAAEKECTFTPTTNRAPSKRKVEQARHHHHESDRAHDTGHAPPSGRASTAAPGSSTTAAKRSYLDLVLESSSEATDGEEDNEMYEARHHRRSQSTEHHHHEHHHKAKTKFDKLHEWHAEKQRQLEEARAQKEMDESAKCSFRPHTVKAAWVADVAPKYLDATVSSISTGAAGKKQHHQKVLSPFSQQRYEDGQNDQNQTGAAAGDESANVPYNHHHHHTPPSADCTFHPVVNRKMTPLVEQYTARPVHERLHDQAPKHQNKTPKRSSPSTTIRIQAPGASPLDVTAPLRQVASGAARSKTPPTTRRGPDGRPIYDLPMDFQQRLFQKEQEKKAKERELQSELKENTPFRPRLSTGTKQWIATSFKDDPEARSEWLDKRRAEQENRRLEKLKEEQPSFKPDVPADLKLRVEEKHKLPLEKRYRLEMEKKRKKLQDLQEQRKAELEQEMMAECSHRPQGIHIPDEYAEAVQKKMLARALKTEGGYERYLQHEETKKKTLLKEFYKDGEVPKDRQDQLTEEHTFKPTVHPVPENIQHIAHTLQMANPNATSAAAASSRRGGSCHHHQSTSSGTTQQQRSHSRQTIESVVSRVGAGMVHTMERDPPPPPHARYASPSAGTAARSVSAKSNATDAQQHHGRQRQLLPHQADGGGNYRDQLVHDDGDDGLALTGGHRNLLPHEQDYRRQKDDVTESNFYSSSPVRLTTGGSTTTRRPQAATSRQPNSRHLSTTVF